MQLLGVEVFFLNLSFWREGEELDGILVWISSLSLGWDSER